MRSTLRRTAAAAALVALAACSSAKRAGENRLVGRMAPTMLVVENRRPVDVTMFLDRSGQRVRLGMVSGPGVGRFAIPADLVASTGALRVIAQPRAERGILEESAVVRPGDTVRFTIDLSDVQIAVDPRN
jgi:hypothetical protein